MKPEPVKDGEWLPVVLGGIAFLIAVAAKMIGDAYHIPALKHYGGSGIFLLMGLAMLIWARADQTSGVTNAGYDLSYIDIKKKEYPFCFWSYVGTYYVLGIFFTVCAVISFFAPNPLF